MAYLRLYDYELPIQDAQLTSLKASNDNIRLVSEQFAQAEIVSALTPKYDVKNEFTDTTVFSYAANYKANSLVELNATAYDPAATYALNAIILEVGKVYICSTAIPVAEAFNAAHWTLLGNQYDLFNVPLPYDLFDIKLSYLKGDIVFWNDKVYKCLQQTRDISHQGNIQRDTVNLNTSYNSNVFPDDKTNGVAMWGVGVAYTFFGLSVVAKVADYTTWSSATTYAITDRVSYNNIIYQSLTANLNKTPGTDITNWQPVIWSAGDNRCLQAVQYILDIAIWQMHKRIAPKNIPELRKVLKDEALEWAEKARLGTVTIDMQEMQPVLQGASTRFNSEPKLKNTYK